MNALIDIALCVWFLLVIFAFWGAYLGLSLPPNILTASYAVFLLFAIARLTLDLLRRRSD